MAALWYSLALALIVAIIDAVCYVGLFPWFPAAPPARARALARRLAPALHGLAYGLSLVRLPFCLLPYVCKLAVYAVLRERFWNRWSSPQARWLRGGGDLLQWLAAVVLIDALSIQVPPMMRWAGQLLLAAEATRLILEKGQTLVSWTWQQLPHARWALEKRWPQPAPAYGAQYYALSPSRRLDRLQRLLALWCERDTDLADKAGYVEGFRVVSPAVDLVAGQVRDIQRGQIFIHARWTQDPWLVIGLALRRSPWVFDPKRLSQPLHYRSQANPRASRFVLEMACYSPPFALYQLGHEIKAARFAVFFNVLAAWGVRLEQPVGPDGVYVFEPGLRWLARHLGRRTARPEAEPRPIRDFRAD